MDDKLVMTVFMHSTIHMFAWKDREMPIRMVNYVKIWIIGAVLCSYVLNLYISTAIDFLLWKVAYISANSYDMIWHCLKVGTWDETCVISFSPHREAYTFCVMLEATKAQGLLFPRYMILLQTSCRTPWSGKGSIAWPTWNNTDRSTSIVAQYQIQVPDKPPLNMWQNLETHMIIGAAVLPIRCVCVCVTEWSIRSLLLLCFMSVLEQNSSMFALTCVYVLVSGLNTALYHNWTKGAIILPY